MSMIVLGIETSCDETAAAIYCTEQGLLANRVYSQLVHQEHGGVVPELASRDHVRKLTPMIAEMLRDEGLEGTDIDGIAYTAGPGLIGALMVGATVAKGLGYAWRVPTLAVHHMEGHLLAPMLDDEPPAFPFVALLVSGGHTQLYDVQGVGQYQMLGQSLDDAAGEAFDKTAKLLGLPYPGGPALAKLADIGNPQAFDLPRPMLQQPGLDFSFSGLKTAVAQTVQRWTPMNEDQRQDLAASFQQAVIEVLVTKCQRALEQAQRNTLIVAGGVSANQQLRRTLIDSCQAQGQAVHFPPPAYCTDNAAMIAYAAAQRLLKGQEDRDFSIRARARWPMTELSDENE